MLINDFTIVKEEIRKSISEIAEISEDKITEDAKLVEDLGVDSLMALEIVTNVEKLYRVKVPPEKIPTIRTLNNIVTLLKEIQGE
jgi:acyl carrier protein